MSSDIFLFAWWAGMGVEVPFSSETHLLFSISDLTATNLSDSYAVHLMQWLTSVGKMLNRSPRVHHQFGPQSLYASVDLVYKVRTFYAIFHSFFSPLVWVLVFYWFRSVTEIGAKRTLDNFMIWNTVFKQSRKWKAVSSLIWVPCFELILTLYSGVIRWQNNFPKWKKNWVLPEQ